MYDMLDVFDVEAPGGDVCGDQDPPWVLGEPVEVLEPLPLLHLCVEAQGADPEVAQQADQPPDAVDRVAEDQGPPRVLAQHVVEVKVFLSDGAPDSRLNQGVCSTYDIHKCIH